MPIKKSKTVVLQNKGSHEERQQQIQTKVLHIKRDKSE